MKKITNIILNTVFFSAIVVITLVITTISLTKKINDSRKNLETGIQGVVTKKEIPILSMSKGVVTKSYFKAGQEVKKNDLLVEIDNPLLRGKIEALKQYPDNISAQTEAKVAQEELKGMKIYSPVNGVVTDINIAEGSPVDTLIKVMTIYSNDNIRLLADLSDEQYQTLQQMGEISAYSQRLNQNFTIKPDLLRPDKKLSQYNEKKLGLYFTFADSQEAKSLLENEDLLIGIKKDQENSIKPFEIFVNFWNKIIPKSYTPR